MKSEKTEIQLAPMDLRKTISECVDFFAVQTKEKNLYLDSAIDEEIPNMLIADESGIKQILINLISNAVKFTEKGGISLDIKGFDKYNNKTTLCFMVNDTGIGIQEEFLDRIFLPSEQEGAGNGLSASYDLAEKMGGCLTATSTPREGSCFVLTLTLDLSM